MRPFVILLAFATAFSILLLVVASQLATAGSVDAPEISDPAGDCETPYGNLYLDITAAWIDAEDADSFDVHLQLAGWQEPIAEGAGYAVQFVHQGVQWGVIAFYSPAVEDGWVFWTGQATLADVSNTVDAVGSFDAGTSTIHVTFPKDLFPHNDPNDTTLREFHALSVDVRPAYPFILLADTPAAMDPDGRWVACDDAISDATFAFASGGHSSGHVEHEAAAPSSEAAAEAEVVEPAAAPPSEPAPAKKTPLGPLAALGALAATRRR